MPQFSQDQIDNIIRRLIRLSDRDVRIILQRAHDGAVQELIDACKFELSRRKRR